MRSLLLILATLRFISAADGVDDASSPNDALLAACTGPRGEDSPEDVAAALAAGADINSKDERTGQTCLMASTLRGKDKILRYLLKNGADATIPERDGYTPPHGSGFQGRIETMRLLKETGVDILNAEHPDGFYPLHRACWGREPRHSEVVEYLLELGEDPDRRGTGEIQKTCWEMTENPDTIAILKKYGATDPEAEDANESSPGSEL